MKHRISKPIKLVVLCASLALYFAAASRAGNKPAPGQSSAFGQTLAEWQDTYFRWFIGQLVIPSDSNGNAVVNGVVLMPLPNAPALASVRLKKLEQLLNSGNGGNK